MLNLNPFLCFSFTLPHAYEKFLTKAPVLIQKKTTAHERQREHYQTGEWSTGKKWADDAPKESVSAEEVSIMSSGACGAFVHTFEDEFMGKANIPHITRFFHHSSDAMINVLHDLSFFPIYKSFDQKCSTRCDFIV